MLKKLYRWTLGWAGSPRAELAMGTVSFVESSVFPIPADVLFIPMVAARPERAWRYALIATVTSVLGGIFGWLLAHYAYDAVVRPILSFYHKAETFDRLRESAAGSTLLILVLLVTSGLAHLPPMKVVTLLSGAIGFPLPLFTLSAMVARGGRFFALAWVLRRWGPAVLHFIEKHLPLAAGGLLAALALVWLTLRLA